MSAHRYADVRNSTASKERLMVMLLEAALRHMRDAAKHLDAKNRKAATPLLIKAANIVVALQSSLKPELAPKLVNDLVELYTFTAARIGRAIATGKSADVRQAERAFAPIVEGFAHAVAALAKPGTPGAPVTAARP